MRILINDGWQISSDREGPYEPVALPHDWLIAEVALWSRPSRRWYRRTLDCSTLGFDERLFILFDGIYQISTLSVNGEEVLIHYNGYTPFHADITPWVKRVGSNELRVEVEYRYPSGRWYTGAGIYRDVSLVTKGRRHIDIDGIYVAAHLDEGAWRYEVSAEVTCDRPYELVHTLLDGGAPIESWDVENPVLYQLRSELLCDGEVEDTVYTTVGFRSLTFSANEGFSLNGRTLKLKGVCLHHDLGSLGSAVHKEALERQILLMKGMGANAIRTAHNPPSPHLYEICDRLGMLVVSEFTDVWNQRKNTHDYSSHFAASMHEDVASWIRGGRTHPSVIMWSIGNEIADTHTDEMGGRATIAAFLSLIASLDPKEHARVTLCSNYLGWEATQRCVDPIALVGYNYGSSLYAAHHRRYPHWVIFGSETCATVQSRGVYHFPLSIPTLSDDDMQCSALGNGITSWGAASIEECLAVEEETPYSLGQFIWAGIDYLGEPTPYHTKSSYLGHVDSAGFKKDSYYLFKAAWSEEPVLHLFPHWDFNEGQAIDVRVYTNAHRVELLLNGVSQGSRTLEGAWSAVWRVAYRPGTIEAVAYDREERVIAHTSRSSFGEATSLRVHQRQIGSLVFATIEALDEQGRVVDNARLRARVTVRGGRLLALDNGDATDLQSYHDDTRRLFGGTLLAIAEGPDSIVQATADTSDVVCRAIRLEQNGWKVKATPLPESAAGVTLSWRLTDLMGVPTASATLEVSEDGREAVITPITDGVVVVRCGTANGKDHWDFYSRLEIPIQGYRVSYTNPYHYVWGIWYDRQVQALTMGNERGVATLRDRVSTVTFRTLDFGSWGSDEITIDLFPLESDPFFFDIKSGDELLLKAHWSKGSIWNTYQSERYTLARRLRSREDLTFVFDRKVHLRGFRFKRAVKAYSRLDLALCDTIIADDYRRAGTEVHHITNNASITFEGMDFFDGAEALHLRYRNRRHAAVMGVHIAAEGDVHHRDLLLEGGPGWREATFCLDIPACRSGTVTLQLLPGAAIDLAWLQFIPIGGEIDARDHEK